MSLVNKSDLVSIFGSGYRVVNDKNAPSGYSIREIICSFPNNHDCYDTVDEAFTHFLKFTRKDAESTIAKFETEKQKFGNKVLLFRHSMGWLPEKRMKSISKKLESIQKARDFLSKPFSMYDMVIPLAETFYCPAFFFKPSQECFVFKKAHNIMFKSSITTVHVTSIEVSVQSTENEDIPTVYMDTSFNENEQENSVRINPSTLKTLKDGYISTINYGVYLFLDKSECLSFAKHSLQETIDVLNSNIELLETNARSVV